MSGRIKKVNSIYRNSNKMKNADSMSKSLLYEASNNIIRINNELNICTINSINGKIYKTCGDGIKVEIGEIKKKNKPKIEVYSYEIS